MMKERQKKIIWGLVFAIALSVWCVCQKPVYAEGASETALQNILAKKNVLALIYLTDYYQLRETPCEEAKTVVRVAGGQQVQIQDVVMAEEQEAWVLVTCMVDGENYTGYVNRQNLACSDELFLSWEKEYGMNPVLPQEMFMAEEGKHADIELFPESYQDALYELKATHPNWVFVKMNTGLKWDTVVAQELQGGRSLIHGSNVTAMKEGFYGQNWYYASEEALEYYLDPRNGLTENRVFQFEQLTYNETYHTETALQLFLDNTFMKGKIPDTVMTYAFGITAIGKQYNISPFHLASRVYQEQGDGTSPMISGTYPDYEGYYNYYNIGATGSSNKEVIQNGLKYAMEQDPPWDTHYYSLHFGAEQIAANYIAKGQDTLYLQKFDVDSSDGQLYWHQYMQNIGAPNSEGASIRKLYESAGSLDNTFVFKIPVYEDMPEAACEKPESSNRVVLNILEDYSELQVYMDGIPVTAVKKNGYYVAQAPDDQVKTAVMYRYDENNVPAGMAVWELNYDGSGYLVNEMEGLRDIFSYHGFSIRIIGRSGIRYKSGILQEAKSLLAGAGIEGYTLKEYGTLVLTNGKLGDRQLTLSTENVASGLAYGMDGNGKFVDKVLEQADGRDRFASVLVGLPVSEYKTEFAFRAYMILTKNGEDIVVYGPQKAKSIYELAQQLLTEDIYPEGSSPYMFMMQLISDADAHASSEKNGEADLYEGKE